MDSSPKTRITSTANENISPGLGSRAFTLLGVAISSSAVLPLALYAYLGTFARYLADDYCDSFRLMNFGGIWSASVDRYMRWSGDYSNLLFIWTAEWFDMWGMTYMAAATLILWLIGLTWFMVELGKISGLYWKNWISFVLACLAISLSLYRTPLLYQMLYWRSSMIGYLAPLVLLAYLAAFFLYLLRSSINHPQSIAAGIIIGIGVFVAGGTSETVDALQIGVFFFILFVLYIWRRSIAQKDFLMLSISLGSALLSMLVMALAPGNLVRMRVSTLPAPNLFALGVESLVYGLQFLFDTFKVTTLPAFLSFFIPLLLILGTRAPFSELPARQAELKNKLKWLALLIPLCLLVATVFSFAPSAYAQSYPSVRVRFPALFLLTVTLMAEGAIVGYFLGEQKLNSSQWFRWSVIGALVLSFLYPIRIAMKLYSEIPEYRSRALAWDARDLLIRQAVANGETDLTVIQLDTIEGVQEYKGDERFWANRCAADFYGLNSLRAP